MLTVRYEPHDSSVCNYVTFIIASTMRTVMSVSHSERNWTAVPKEAESFSVLGAFAKLSKATISLVMSVCPTVRPHRTTLLPLGNFDKTSYSSFFFRKRVEKIQVSLKSGKNNGYFT